MGVSITSPQTGDQWSTTSLITWTASDPGGQALSFLKKNEIHMILTDQRMPGMSGVELLEKAREVRRPGPPAAGLIENSRPGRDWPR